MDDAARRDVRLLACQVQRGRRSLILTPTSSQRFRGQLSLDVWVDRSSCRLFSTSPHARTPQRSSPGRAKRLSRHLPRFQRPQSPSSKARRLRTTTGRLLTSKSPLRTTGADSHARLPGRPPSPRPSAMKPSPRLASDFSERPRTSLHHLSWPILPCHAFSSRPGKMTITKNSSRPQPPPHCPQDCPPLLLQHHRRKMSRNATLHHRQRALPTRHQPPQS